MRYIDFTFIIINVGGLKMTKGAVIKADIYDEQVVELAIKELLNELGGISEFIKHGGKVLIKPSMVDGVKKELSVTTHP
jgi:uncharacterized protein (DUF362 family)